MHVSFTNCAAWHMVLMSLCLFGTVGGGNYMDLSTWTNPTRGMALKCSKGLLRTVFKAHQLFMMIAYTVLSNKTVTTALILSMCNHHIMLCTGYSVQAATIDMTLTQSAKGAIVSGCPEF